MTKATSNTSSRSSGGSARPSRRKPTYRYVNDDRIYSVNDIQSLCIDLPTVKKRKGAEYLNAPFSFDIETSSFYDDDRKTAVMYAWVLSIVGHTIIGRTWEEFMMCLDFMRNRYGLSKNRRLVIYVHNLSFEFAFIQKRFQWEETFSNDERKPIYALTDTGFEFRCSYYLSGYSLATVGKNLTRYKVMKMEGDLDYSKVRFAATPLDPTEMKYVQHDGLVVTSFIQECIEKDGDITKIPLTKTGYVRKFCRTMCFYGGVRSHRKSGVYRVYKNYRRLMESMTIDGPDEYRQLKRAFHGGFTHASPVHSGFVRSNVASFDFTSSYPAVMVTEKYPITKGRIVEIHSREEMDRYMKLYCCIFDIEFNDLEAITLADNPISSSKCFAHEEMVLDNGRVVSAKRIVTTMTNVDFSYLHYFYHWSSMRVTNFRIYKKAYLPRNFILAILTMYQKKTELKGVEGMEEEYQHNKENLNSSFGMSVTDICRPEILFEDGEWTTQIKDMDEMIEKYNTSKKRFLCYQWGVFITAYAQRNLFTGIIECIRHDDAGEEIGCDYMYSDTDSLKIVNYKDHMGYIERYNEMIKRKLRRMCDERGIDFVLTHPKTKDGVEKWLGVWDFEGTYRRFKTLGAKRYMVEKEDGSHVLTVSGLNKNFAMPYMEKLAREQGIDVFDVFAEDMYIPPEHTGKNIHTYIDSRMEGTYEDYLGNRFHYVELSGCHIEPSDYTLSLAADYVKYLLGIRSIRT